MRSLRQALILAGALALCLTTPSPAQSYHLAKTTHIGGDGGWDYIAMDSVGHRLFIAHSTIIVVVDPDNGKVLGTIDGLNGAHGTALAYQAGHGFSTSGRDSTVTMFDLKTLSVLGRIPTAPDDDAVLFDPATNRVFTFNGDAASSTVIDPDSGVVLGTIPLPGKPEFGVSSGDGKLYVNLEDSSAVAEIDPARMTVTRHWSLAPCESPTGLAIDRAHHLLFSGCRNKLMAISDASAGKLLTTEPIGDGVDGCAFDPGSHLAFASNGDGTVTVVREDTPTSFRVLANVATKRGARTIALDEKTHRVYTVSADYGPTPAPTPDHPRPRPSIVPDTFVLLTLDP
jgi:DNA-binding beta-propeller fold protein YncE